MTAQNVAYLLHDLLRSFQVPSGHTPEKAQGFSGMDDLTSWRNHVHAFRLVEHVGEAIAYLETQGTRVNVYVKHLPSWYAAIGFAYLPWGSTHQIRRDVCSEASLDALEALGSALEGRSPLLLDDSDQESLLQVVRDATRLVQEDPDLGPEIRAHLLWLLGDAEFLLKHLETYGADAVREVLLRFSGAAYRHAETTPDPERKSTWRDLARRAAGAAGLEMVKEIAREGIKALPPGVGG